MEQGYVHVYTGNGKGKTTAAVGLAVRAACAGKRVYIGQFIKDMAYSETAICGVLPLIEIEQLGKGCFIVNPPSREDLIAAQRALDLCMQRLKGGVYDVVILDEVFIAVSFQLISVEELLAALKQRAFHVEVVLTGRNAPNEIVDYADLVTEMKEIKHYYKKGVLSRKGIDC